MSVDTAIGGRGKENTSSISDMRCIMPYMSTRIITTRYPYESWSSSLRFEWNTSWSWNSNPSMIHQFRSRPSGYIPTTAWSTTSSSWTSRYHTTPEVIRFGKIIKWQPRWLWSQTRRPCQEPQTTVTMMFVCDQCNSEGWCSEEEYLKVFDCYQLRIHFQCRRLMVSLDF